MQGSYQKRLESKGWLKYGAFKAERDELCGALVAELYKKNIPFAISHDSDLRILYIKAKDKDRAAKIKSGLELKIRCAV